MITLRPADETDAPTIVFLMHEAFREYADVLDPPSGVHRETEASVREKMRTGYWLLAEDGGRPVGCVFAEARGDHVYLGRLAVLPEFRGQGIADALTDAVEAGARAENIRRVQLATRVALPRLIAMYERRSYHIISFETHAGYAEPTYVVMEKAIEEIPFLSGRTD